MALIVAVVRDLLLASKVEATLLAAGHEVGVASSLDVAVDRGADAVVVDLGDFEVEEVAALDIPTLGFYSHVDVETRRRAEAAGLERVVPRSRLARELPELIDRLVG